MTHAQHIRNLLDVYDRTHSRDLPSALGSYQRYHDLCAEIAHQTGHPVAAAVGVFAALSPNNSYVSNLRNCRTMLRAAKAGCEIDDFRVNTYNTNKRKAWLMAARGFDPLWLFRGLKTRSFYLNVLHPADPGPVTVDGHMFWAWMGRKGVVKTRDFTRSENAPPSLSDSLYNEIADGLRLVGELRGCIGCQAQAVVWQTWRRIHNVMGATQLELLAQDVFAAGRPDHALGLEGCGQ